MANAKSEMTQIKALEIAIAEGGRADDVQAKLEEVYKGLLKKKENRKPKEVTDEDKAYTALIVDTLKGADTGLTIGEIIAKTDFGVTLSSSKVTALVKKIPEVKVNTDKRKNYYSLGQLILAKGGNIRCPLDERGRQWHEQKNR